MKKDSMLVKITNLQDKIKSDPENPEYYWQIGQDYDDINNHPYAVCYYYKAIHYLKNAIKNDHKSAKIYNLMGLCLDSICLPHQAILYYKKASELNPKFSVYYYNLSSAEEEASDYTNSIKDMEHAIKLNPGSVDAYNQLGITNAEVQNYEEAISDEHSAITLNRLMSNPDNPCNFYNIADDEIKLQEYTLGLQYIKYAISLFPDKSKVPALYTNCLSHIKSKLHAHNNKPKLPSLSYNPNINYMKQLNQLIGLKHVKSAIKTFIRQVEMNKIRLGKRVHNRMHLVFEGDPGTGKTTVAKLICRILYQKAIISKKRLTCINATQLISKNYGESSGRIRKIVNNSVGGVLFIDEAYYLTHRTDGNSACQDEALDGLLTAIDKHNNDLVVILAGYKKQMDNFFKKSNPGLQSRFPKDDRIVFPDYSSNECLKILYYFLHKNDYEVIDDNAKTLLNKYMHKYMLTKINDSRHTFANARAVKNIYERLIKVQVNRLFDEYSINQLTQDKQLTNKITSTDIKNTFKCFSLKSFNKATDELNDLIGLKNVKHLVSSYINLVRVLKIRHGNANPNGMDLVFEGNPGTGKTTVAKIFCKLLYQKGLVKSNNYVSLSASMLEGPQFGQGAKNLRKAFYDAKGGVLFIDEAYTLLNSKKYKDNLLSELVADITKYKNSVVVIMAGYPKAMENFLKNGNAGLSSRFSYRVPFKDYSDQECLQILYYGLNKDSLHVDPKAKKLLNKGFIHVIKQAKSNDQYKFANARTVNTFLKYLKQNFANRLCSKSNPTWLKALKILHDDRLNTINAQDINSTLKQYNKWYKKASSSHRIGFK